ncbi:MAG: discoidin domain-containing protein [Nitrososphaeraceae archaeon]|nr:discoidin domain-containing protein [Nitrososphaeraceae archaeon]
MIQSLNQNKKYVLLSSILIMMLITSLESSILLTANAQSDEKTEKSADTEKSDEKSEKSADTEKSDADSNKKEINVPVAKMVYQNKSYEMSPFVVMDNENLERINFPHLPDDFEPEVTISPEDPISFSFLTKPREINAFFIDYDADTTEMTPLHRVGKTQFSFGDVYGPNTLELRVIYPDGKYVTYTCLIEVDKPEVQEVALDSSNISTMSTDDNINIMSTDDNNIMSTDMLNSNNNDDNSYQSFESNDPDSSGFGQASPTEEHVINQYDNLVNSTNGQHHEELNFPNSEQQSTKTCEYNEIPIMDVQTDTNNVNNTNGNSTESHKPRWTALDLGQEQYICGLKVSFVNVDNEIKFFTLEFSNDGKKYTAAEYYSSTGTNSPSEIYDLKEGPIKARFIKITELDITESIAWISDLIVLGNAQL